MSHCAATMPADRGGKPPYPGSNGPAEAAISSNDHAKERFSMSKYVPEDVEKKWQAVWEDGGHFKVEADPARPKYYVLEMFPY
ncbi:MAG TPA: hypothetical protein DIU49_09745, partial [Desulfovibrio sp.]|nr:hypothetical protein [Desulfovibrio sp.]